MTDYTGHFDDIFKDIVDNATHYIVDLSTVPDGTTAGVFVVTTTTTTNDDGTTTTTTTQTATFKTAAEDEDTVIGTVTAEKVYEADSSTDKGQTIEIPEGWNVTATGNADTLNVNGNNVTVKGGSGSDSINVKSGVTNITLADLETTSDKLSFETAIEENSLTQSAGNNQVTLSSSAMSITIQGVTSLSNDLLGYSVTNGSGSSTIQELLVNILNPGATHRLSLSGWTYGFTPAAGTFATVKGGAATSSSTTATGSDTRAKGSTSAMLAPDATVTTTAKKTTASLLSVTDASLVGTSAIADLYSTADTDANIFSAKLLNMTSVFEAETLSGEYMKTLYSEISSTIAAKK